MKSCNYTLGVLGLMEASRIEEMIGNDAIAQVKKAESLSRDALSEISGSEQERKKLLKAMEELGNILDTMVYNKPGENIVSALLEQTSELVDPIKMNCEGSQF